MIDEYERSVLQAKILESLQAEDAVPDRLGHDLRRSRGIGGRRPGGAAATQAEGRDRRWRLGVNAEVEPDL